ncbi:DUF6772 family protein [Microlunatus soli]|uniref:Uncharacterized protein n=1 Tax=Microlunatus soli TaxID=630515 RepID=A0A1H1ZII3_9ACTN|nr:DUF6772 family protein [Microlunatus soli]SDT33463.1 hypothetical protein SAMN04489812_5244 [Microlunatus soli]
MINSTGSSTLLPGWFRPLPRLLTADDFDNGMGGWLDLRPNFVGPDFAAHDDEIDLEHWGSVMLSSATYPFSGTHGSATGTYSLKLATRFPAAAPDQAPAPGSMSLAIKRLSRPYDARLLRVETMIAYTTDQDRPGLGVDAMRAFGLMIDLQDAEHRFMPGVRFVNTTGGVRQRRWQFYRHTEDDDAAWSYGREGWHQAGIDPQWFGVRAADGSTSATTWFDDGIQQPIYNETDDKINWMPFSLTLDLERRTYHDFRFGNRSFGFPDGAGPTLADPYAGIDNLLNPVFFVETDTDRRVNLYLDSVVISYASHDDLAGDEKAGEYR